MPYNSSLFNGSGSGGTVTAETLISDAYRDLGVLRAGQTTAPEAMDDGLRRLNRMIDSWATERLSIRAIARELFDLVAGQLDYEIGAGGEFDTVRPVRIERAGYLNSGSTSEDPFEVLTLDRWRSGLAGVYCDYAFPLAAININPAPSAGDRLALYTWTSLDQFASLTDTYELPPGFELALCSNLAVQLAPSARIHTKISDVLYDAIADNARKSKAAIKRLQVRPRELKCDAALLSHSTFDTLTGRYR